MEGPAWRAYQGLIALYAVMSALTSIISSHYYNDYYQTGNYLYYSAYRYWLSASFGFNRGFTALVQWIPLEWYYLTTGTTSRSTNDGLLSKDVQAPSFFALATQLQALGANHMEQLAHPNAINQLTAAFDGVGVPRK